MAGWGGGTGPGGSTGPGGRDSGPSGPSNDSGGNGNGGNRRDRDKDRSPSLQNPSNGTQTPTGSVGWAGSYDAHAAEFNRSHPGALGVQTRAGLATNQAWQDTYGSRLAATASGANRFGGRFAQGVERTAGRYVSAALDAFNRGPQAHRAASTKSGQRALRAAPFGMALDAIVATNPLLGLLDDAYSGLRGVADFVGVDLPARPSVSSALDRAIDVGNVELAGDAREYGFSQQQVTPIAQQERTAAIARGNASEAGFRAQQTRIDTRQRVADFRGRYGSFTPTPTGTGITGLRSSEGVSRLSRAQSRQTALARPAALPSLADEFTPYEIPAAAENLYARRQAQVAPAPTSTTAPSPRGFDPIKFAAQAKPRSPSAVAADKLTPISTIVGDITGIPDAYQTHIAPVVNPVIDRAADFALRHNLHQLPAVGGKPAISAFPSPEATPFVEKTVEGLGIPTVVAGGATGGAAALTGSRLAVANIQRASAIRSHNVGVRNITESESVALYGTPTPPQITRGQSFREMRGAVEQLGKKGSPAQVDLDNLPDRDVFGRMGRDPSFAEATRARGEALSSAGATGTAAATPDNQRRDRSKTAATTGGKTPKPDTRRDVVVGGTALATQYDLQTPAPTTTNTPPLPDSLKPDFSVSQSRFTAQTPPAPSTPAPTQNIAPSAPTQAQTPSIAPAPKSVSASSPSRFSGGAPKAAPAPSRAPAPTVRAPAATVIRQPNTRAGGFGGGPGGATLFASGNIGVGRFSRQATIGEGGDGEEELILFPQTDTPLATPPPKLPAVRGGKFVRATTLAPRNERRGMSHGLRFGTLPQRRV